MRASLEISLACWHPHVRLMVTAPVQEYPRAHVILDLGPRGVPPRSHGTEWGDP